MDLKLRQISIKSIFEEKQTYLEIRTIIVKFAIQMVLFVIKIIRIKFK